MQSSFGFIDICLMVDTGIWFCAVYAYNSWIVKISVRRQTYACSQNQMMRHYMFEHMVQIAIMTTISVFFVYYISRSTYKKQRYSKLSLIMRLLSLKYSLETQVTRIIKSAVMKIHRVRIYHLNLSVSVRFRWRTYAVV